MAGWGSNGERDAIARLPSQLIELCGTKGTKVRTVLSFCVPCSAPHPTPRSPLSRSSRERGHQKAVTCIPMTENIISAHHMCIKNNTDQVSALDKSSICSRGVNSRSVIDGRSSLISSARSSSVRIPRCRACSGSARQVREPERTRKSPISWLSDCHRVIVYLGDGTNLEEGKKMRWSYVCPDKIQGVPENISCSSIVDGLH